MSVTFAVTINSMIAFVLAWLKFPGRRLLFLIILATLTIAFEAKLIPLFLTMQQLHIDNTLPSIFLPWITDAFIIFLLRQHFAELPQDLYDAAIIDGCSFFRMYWQVMLPNITFRPWSAPVSSSSSSPGIHSSGPRSSSRTSQRRSSRWRWPSCSATNTFKLGAGLRRLICGHGAGGRSFSFSCSAITCKVSCAPASNSRSAAAELGYRDHAKNQTSSAPANGGLTKKRGSPN